METELEFLHQRARLLASESFSGEKGDSPHLCEAPFGPFRQMGTVPFFQRWVVSDFWFDQSAAFARAWLSAEQRPAFIEEYECLRPVVVPPRLVVLLDSSPEKLLSRIRRRGRSCERDLTAAQLDRIHQAVIRQAARPDVGPVLHVVNDDHEAVFAEVLAAVRGME